MNIMRHGTTPKVLENLEPFIKNWRPIDGWLIQDENDNFVLPTHHSTLGRKFYKSYKNSVKRSLTFLLLAVLLICVVFIFKPMTQTIEHIALFGMLLIFVTIDMGLSIKSLDNCKQKVEFLFDLQKSFKIVFLIFAPFFFLILLSQLYLSELLGGFEPLVISYGNYYPEIDIGSLWRFVLGPLLHGDINHWLINAVLTILFATMVPITKRF